MKGKIILLVLLLFCVSSIGVLAQRTSDVAGSKDYPLVSRFKGSYIAWYQLKNFDRYYILSLKDNKLDKYEIDGKITRIQYESQKEHSVFEVYKSYEIALKNKGFEILLNLDKTNCGINLSEQIYISEFNGLNALSGDNVKPDYTDGQFAYLSAKKKIDDKEIYIVLYVTRWKNDEPLITFDAIEVQSMQKGLVSVKDIETDILKNGHIAIYDIHFDTGKYEIKPESAEALKNIAKYLNSNSSKKFLIVGHTDNTGNFDDNINLSKNRAKAVVNELLAKYNVNASQLKTYGVGSVSPISSNVKEAGKAKNRRVEIVEQ